MDFNPRDLGGGVVAVGFGEVCFIWFFFFLSRSIFSLSTRKKSRIQSST